MPAMNNILSKWIPVDERSRSLALVYSGMYLGSVTGLAFSPLLIHNYGWPSVFYSFGSLGTVWFALWSSKVRYHSSSLLLDSLITHSLLPRYINLFVLRIGYVILNKLCECRHTVHLLKTQG